MPTCGAQAAAEQGLRATTARCAHGHRRRDARAGASLPLAIESLVREQQPPISQEFALVLREHRLGVSLDEAFERLGERVPSQELILVISAVRIAREVGGNLAETLDRLADTLRKKFAMEGKIAALTSQGKLQGWVVGLLPFAMAAVLYKMEPQAIYPLYLAVAGLSAVVASWNASRSIEAGRLDR